LHAYADTFGSVQSSYVPPMSVRFQFSTISTPFMYLEFSVVNDDVNPAGC